MPGTETEQVALWLGIFGAVSGIIGPVLLNLLSAQQTRKNKAADAEKAKAEATETLTQTALTLVNPLREEIERLQAELDQVKMNWLNERVALQEQITRAKRELSAYMLEADTRDRQSQERIKLLTEQVEQIREAALKREHELLGRIEALESENHTLRRGKKPTGGLPGSGLATA